MKARILFAALALATTAHAASASNASPVQCFEDWTAVPWGVAEQGQRAQTLLFCAQLAASVIAVIDAVDRGRVPEALAGQTARELAATVATGAFTESDRAYQARGQRAPTLDQLRAYIGDDAYVLRAKLPFLQSMVASAWQSATLANTPYPAASKRIVAQWVTAH